MSEQPTIRHQHSGAETGRDSVDAILDAWAGERPDLDFSPVGVVSRMARLRGHFDAALLQVFARYELTAADFQVIITLRRAGRPYRLPQSRLMTQLALTSGTVSVRLERLAKAGIVARGPDPEDKRGSLVTLTAHGLTLFDRVAPVHLANEDRLLSALDESERKTLADLLRRLLISLEDSGGTVGDQLGVLLASAPVARQRRVDVGLSDTAGLLVTEVIEPDLAGALRRGDLLTAVNGVRLRSEVTLAQALPSPGTVSDLQFDVLRGDDPVTIRMTVGNQISGFMAPSSGP